MAILSITILVPAVLQSFVGSFFHLIEKEGDNGIFIHSHLQRMSGVGNDPFVSSIPAETVAAADDVVVVDKGGCPLFSLIEAGLLKISEGGGNRGGEGSGHGGVSHS